MDRLDDFKSLMRRLGDGDVTAAEQVVDRYGEHVTRAIRRRFRTHKMRVLYETEDCLQSVWGSIFSDVERVAKIETPEHLMQYLAKVAANKLIDRDRNLRAQCNDVYRECALPDTGESGRNQLVTGDLTPSQAVAIDDEWEVRTKGLSTENRTILEMHRQGHTSDEIAEQTARSGRGIRRIIQKFRDMFQKYSDDDTGRSQNRRPTAGSSNGDKIR
ncbi:MAG: sigma-70 family RNA polymerase sigma factor [Rhodopirellula sp.]|nr:sigma-70 family RNA polymerase sigma factor [Rhodopirellula sp.]